jgi:hypothetical protein
MKRTSPCRSLMPQDAAIAQRLTLPFEELPTAERRRALLHCGGRGSDAALLSTTIAIVRRQSLPRPLSSAASGSPTLFHDTRLV